MTTANTPSIREIYLFPGPMYRDPTCPTEAAVHSSAPDLSYFKKNNRFAIVTLDLDARNPEHANDHNRKTLWEGFSEILLSEGYWNASSVRWQILGSKDGVRYAVALDSRSLASHPEKSLFVRISFQVAKLSSYYELVPADTGTEDKPSSSVPPLPQSPRLAGTVNPLSTTAYGLGYNKIISAAGNAGTTAGDGDEVKPLTQNLVKLKLAPAAPILSLPDAYFEARFVDEEGNKLHCCSTCILRPSSYIALVEKIETLHLFKRIHKHRPEFKIVCITMKWPFGPRMMCEDEDGFRGAVKSLMRVNPSFVEFAELDVMMGPKK